MLYDALALLVQSPVVGLNRAVAVGMAFGSAAGLEIVDGLTGKASSNTTLTCAATCYSSSAASLRQGLNS